RDAKNHDKLGDKSACSQSGLSRLVASKSQFGYALLLSTGPSRPEGNSMAIATVSFRSRGEPAISLTETIGKLLFAIALAAAVKAPSANAQVYPSRPITMLVGYGVGGPSDTIARIVGERMKSALGQPIVVENVTGAAGSIGAGPPPRGAPRRR